MKNKSPGSQPATQKYRLLRPFYLAYERFLKIRGQPREIALGFALGLFVGMTPFIGLHTLIAVPLAALFKWNKLSAAVSVWFTNAATAPLIYPVTYLVGARITGISKVFNFGEIDSFSAVYDLILKTPEIVWAMTVGGVVLGVPLAVAGYYITFSLVRRYRENIKNKLEKSKEKIARRRKRRKGKPKAKALPVNEHNPVTGDKLASAKKKRSGSSTS